MHNVLSEPLIRVRRSGGGIVEQSLPQVFASMAADHVSGFPALRPHQRHAWHAFLAQLATIAMHRAGQDAPPENADEWLALLRALTPEYAEDEPWRLIVEDAKKPAFLQCPAPSGLKEYREQITAADDLDVLVTSKNHDLKQSIAPKSAPEDWMLALISLQTMAGYLGRGNYGIARMNGGFSARPCLGLAPADGGVGAHLFHDVQRMLKGRDTLLDDYSSYYKPEEGTALLWVEPWTGNASASLRDLDPYFIEICRRIRLGEENGTIIARKAPSKNPRVGAKEANGNIGDFWTPVNIEDGKALSVSNAGFNYRRLVELTLHRKKFQPPPAMQVNEKGGEYQWKLVVRSIAGGQGKTEGYHERTDIVFSHKTASAFIHTEQCENLAEIAEKQISEIKEVSDALRFGVAVAASGGKEAGDISKHDREQAVPYARRLEAVADARFFLALDKRFLASDADDADKARGHRAEFAKGMIKEAQKLFDEAVDSVPCPAIRRHRARAKAARAFWGRLRGSKSVFSDQPEIFTPRDAKMEMRDVS